MPKRLGANPEDEWRQAVKGIMRGVMRRSWRRSAVGALVIALSLCLGTNASIAQSRAHVYLLRGLLNIFSLGMDTLAEELNHRGVYATVHNHTEWQTLADQAAANYRAGKEGPIILIGHSLGADAVMEMAAYLGHKGIPVALVVPFDGTQSYAASDNVGRVLNLTQREYAYMRRGSGFHGSLANVDVSSDHNIDHITIDKSPRLHARVISEVLAVVGSHRGEPPTPSPNGAKPVQASAPASRESGAAPPTGSVAKPEAAPATPAAPAKPGNGATNSGGTTQAADGTPMIALPERGSGDASAAPSKPAPRPQPAHAEQVPN
jgi:Thioesterase domain